MPNSRGLAGDASGCFAAMLMALPSARVLALRLRDTNVELRTLQG